MKKISLKKINFKKLTSKRRKRFNFLDSFKDFLGNINHKIERNKFLSNSYFTRIIIICFFLGINIQLLPFFLETNRVKLPNEILNILDSMGIINKDDYLIGYTPDSFKAQQPSLKSDVLLEKLNEECAKKEVKPFEYSEKLATVAAELLFQAEKYDFELKDRSFIEEMQMALDHADYNYSHVSHNMVVGPLMEDAVIDAWFSDEKQVKALFEDDFKEVGFATKIIKTKYDQTLGVVVQVLGAELPKRPASSLQTINTQTQDKQSQIQKARKTEFPEISNKEVFEALNRYRQDHKISNLELDENLCKYAEKRVQDLVAFGTLDNHEGFKKDLIDENNLPEPIRNYAGSKIAENLAYQYCKNMTTGDSFIAQTGTAIIEWCFDSSTIGHREAQLNSDFKNACIRNANGMFVVIFGGR